MRMLTATVAACASAVVIGCGGAQLESDDSVGRGELPGDGLHETAPASPSDGEASLGATDGVIAAPAPAPAVSPEAAEDDGAVDCDRLDDPDYRASAVERGIDPDSIECGECDGCEE